MQLSGIHIHLLTETCKLTTRTFDMLAFDLLLGCVSPIYGIQKSLFGLDIAAVSFFDDGSQLLMKHAGSTPVCLM